MAICACAVYWRVPTYLDWYRRKRPRRLWQVILEGFVAGLVVALPFTLTGGSEPSLSMQLAEYAIWFAVLGLIGALNSVALYAINALVARRLEGRR